VTHNLSEGLELCDRVMIQNRGELVFQGLGEHLDKAGFEELYFQAVEEGGN
jgi:ABC-type multidrug transport system ATPase subunit